MKHAGFTLIEMMVVVAIIGVLSAIAIPAYNKYVSKARQSEAKIELASIYTAEQAYAVENSTFTACISMIGIGAPTGKFFYDVGVNHAGGSNQCGPKHNATCSGYAWNLDGTVNQQCGDTEGVITTGITNSASQGISQAGKVGLCNPANINNLVYCGVSTLDPGGAGTMTIEASGQIATSCNGPFDIWTIDQSNNLINCNPAL